MYILAPSFLAELYNEITPQHAARWEVIGRKLSLPKGQLEAIKAEWPTNFKHCCNRMLDKWIEVDTTASWEKMNAVILDIQASEGDLAFLYSYI